MGYRLRSAFLAGTYLVLVSGNLHGADDHDVAIEKAKEAGAAFTEAANLKLLVEQFARRVKENPQILNTIQSAFLMEPALRQALNEVLRQVPNAGDPVRRDPIVDTLDPFEPAAQPLPNPSVEEPETVGEGRDPGIWRFDDPDPGLLEEELRPLPGIQPLPRVTGGGTPYRAPVPESGGIQESESGAPSAPGSRRSPASATASRRGQDWVRGFEAFARAARQVRETRKSVERGIARRDLSRRTVHQEKPAPSLEALGPRRDSRPASPAPREIAARRAPVRLMTAGKASAPGGASAPRKPSLATAAVSNGAPPALPPKKMPLAPLASAVPVTVSTAPATGSVALSFKVPGLPLAGATAVPAAFSTGDWTVGENLEGETAEEAPLPQTDPDAVVPVEEDSPESDAETEIAASVGIPTEWETPLALLLLLGLAGVTALGSAGGAAGSAAGVGPSRFLTVSVARLFAPIWEGRSRAAVAAKPATERSPAALARPRPALYRSVLGLAWAATFGFAFYLVRGLRGVLGAKRRRDR